MRVTWMDGRGRLLAGAAAAGAVLLGASTAWACYADNAGKVPYYLNQPNPEQAPPGTAVSVTGANWVPNQVMQVGWSAEGTAFSTPTVAVTPRGDAGTIGINLRVPTVEPGVMYVLATQGDARRAVPFRVVGTTAAQGVPDGEEAGAASGPAGGSAAAAGSDGVEQGSSGPARSSGGTGGIPAGPSAGSAGPPGSAVSEPGSDTVTAPAPVSQTAGLAAPRATAASSAGSRANTASSAAPSVDENGSEEAPAARRGASGELWSGFSGNAPSEGPSLADLPAAPGGTDPATTAGQVLAVGLVALGAGFTLAETRRRRQPVS